MSTITWTAWSTSKRPTLSPGTSVLAIACASSESADTSRPSLTKPPRTKNASSSSSRGSTPSAVPKAITASTIVVGDRKLSSSAAVRASTMLYGVRERGRVTAYSLSAWPTCSRRSGGSSATGEMTTSSGRMKGRGSRLQAATAAPPHPAGLHRRVGIDAREPQALERELPRLQPDRAVRRPGLEVFGEQLGHPQPPARHPTGVPHRTPAGRLPTRDCRRPRSRPRQGMPCAGHTPRRRSRLTAPSWRSSSRSK